MDILPGLLRVAPVWERDEDRYPGEGAVCVGGSLALDVVPAEPESLYT